MLILIYAARREHGHMARLKSSNTRKVAVTVCESMFRGRQKCNASAFKLVREQWEELVRD